MMVYAARPQRRPAHILPNVTQRFSGAAGGSGFNSRFADEISLD
jgi:hypothetical protein